LGTESPLEDRNMPGSPTGSAGGWLADARTSYDTVADSYADFVRDSPAREPYLRAALALFAELVHPQ
jgi:hypothetical protein